MLRNEREPGARTQEQAARQLVARFDARSPNSPDLIELNRAAEALFGPAAPVAPVVARAQQMLGG